MAGRKLKALEDEVEALRDELEKGRARNDGQVCGESGEETAWLLSCISDTTVTCIILTL